MRVYATAEEFAASVWCPLVGAPTGNTLARLLTTASSNIEHLTRNDVYDVDEQGKPTNLATAEAFRDATCAQAAYAHETGDVSGAGIGMGSMSIGSLSLGGKRADSQNADDVLAALLSTEAVNILRNAGLCTGIVSGSW